MRKRNWKRLQANCMDEAVQLCTEHAAQVLRRPAKVIADLMGVELKTYYRWLADNSMPVHRLRQFETFCGAHYLSDYLAVASGRVVITIPSGRGAKAGDLAEVHAAFSEAMAALGRFYQDRTGVDEAVAAVNATLTQLVWQRENVAKHATPELDLF